MNRLFITLAAFSLALIIGCQEQMINEPSANMLKHQDDQTNTNNITMNYKVWDPVYGTRKVTGEVTYLHELIIQPMGPIGFHRVHLIISIDSELENLTSMSPVKWRVSAKSEDIVTVSEEGIVLLEKSYWITGRPDVVLLVKYLVTTEGVGISGVSLAPLEK